MIRRRASLPPVELHRAYARSKSIASVNAPDIRTLIALVGAVIDTFGQQRLSVKVGLCGGVGDHRVVKLGNRPLW